MIAVARALPNSPSIILDGLTGSLNSDNSQKIVQLLNDLHIEEDITLIIITHDLNIGEEAERVINILDGKLRSNEVL
ncbi:MAG: hypothetical protein LBB45_08890 [Methanobrevibacter sp.]|jgi:putative ABC transport system ATP-binding protein|nr:hypothetical protein [Candidatus Methanovirga basalitermitum]